MSKNKKKNGGTTTSEFASLSKLQLESAAVDKFMEKYTKSKYGTKSLGQAFYDHFKLNRLEDQKQLNNICAKDGQRALKCISSFVSLN